MQNLNEQIVIEAKSWLGVPFRHLGRSRRGVDCVGLIICVAHALNLTDYDTRNYARRPNVIEFVSEFKRNMDRVNLKKAGHGHVLLTREVRFPAHCGIIEVDELQRQWLIHSYEPFGKVVREPIRYNQERAPLFAFQYRSA